MDIVSLSCSSMPTADCWVSFSMLMVHCCWISAALYCQRITGCVILSADGRTAMVDWLLCYLMWMYSSSTNYPPTARADSMWALEKLGWSPVDSYIFHYSWRQRSGCLRCSLRLARCHGCSWFNANFSHTVWSVILCDEIAGHQIQRNSMKGVVKKTTAVIDSWYELHGWCSGAVEAVDQPSQLRHVST